MGEYPAANGSIEDNLLLEGRLKKGRLLAEIGRRKNSGRKKTQRISYLEDRRVFTVARKTPYRPRGPQLV